jgi:hypothetical protein
MRIRPTVLAIFAVVGLGWMATSAAPQNAQPVPGVGTGVTTVVGTVNVGNTPAVTIANAPAVTASQQGEWKVAVSNTPSVIVALPAFVRAGVRYECMWPGGEREILRVGAVAAGGWVRVDGPPVRWVNISLARSLEEKP